MSVTRQSLRTPDRSWQQRSWVAADKGKVLVDSASLLSLACNKHVKKGEKIENLVSEAKNKCKKQIPELLHIPIRSNPNTTHGHLSKAVCSFPLLSSPWVLLLHGVKSNLAHLMVTVSFPFYWRIKQLPAKRKVQQLQVYLFYLLCSRLIKSLAIKNKVSICKASLSTSLSINEISTPPPPAPPPES